MSSSTTNIGNLSLTVKSLRAVVNAKTPCAVVFLTRRTGDEKAELLEHGALVVTWPNIGIQAHPFGDAGSGRAVLPLEPILVGDESDGPGDSSEGD